MTKASPRSKKHSHVSDVQEKAHLLRRRLSKPLDMASRKFRMRKRMPYVKWQILISLVMIGLTTIGCSDLGRAHLSKPWHHHRRLTEPESKCPQNTTTTESNGDFPDDPFTLEQRQGGAVLFHIAVMLYMFAALAIVCDGFFEGALAQICIKWHISNDVAGATWMAAGGSAPELATSMIGALITKSDIGFGTIVGSAVFNVLFVIGACAFAVGSALRLTSYPLTRDSTWYTICLFAIVLFVGDQKVQPYEAAILFIMYLLYIVIMKYNNQIHDSFRSAFGKYKVGPSENSKRENGEEKAEDSEEDDDDDDLLAWPDTIQDRIIHIILLPLKIFMVCTIPDASSRPRLYLVTFFGCVLHIAVYSYVMVWMASSVGKTLSIPDPVMGVTILAMGTSIPDAISSIVVAKRGHGDMAVSSSIGSNIFDITVGLPIPWLLYCLRAYVGNNPEDLPYVVIESKNMWLSVGTLLLMLISTILAIHFNGWRLNKRLGFMLMFLYILFFIQTLILFFADQQEAC